MITEEELRSIDEHHKYLWRLLYAVSFQCNGQAHFEFKDKTQDGEDDSGFKEKVHVERKRTPDFFVINEVEVTNLEMQYILYRIVRFKLERNSKTERFFWEDRRKHGLPHFEDDRRLIKWEGDEFIAPSREEMRKAIEEMEDFLRSIKVVKIPTWSKTVRKLMEGG